MKLFVPPAASVIGTVKPTAEKPAPPTVALEMVALCVPEFFNCTNFKMLVPTGTLPNWRLLGVASSGTGATPVPPREKVTKAVIKGPAPLPIITLPDAEPAFVGSNFIDITTCAPGAIDMGGVMPLTVYMSPRRFSLFNTVIVDPVFLIVT
jgi:hypothetical protein